MIFALHVAHHFLHLFVDADAAIAHCSADEVSGQAWLFFGYDGSPLRPEFIGSTENANGIVRQERYFLRPWASCSSCSLAQVLPFVEAVAGPPGMDSKENIERYLAQLNN